MSSDSLFGGGQTGENTVPGGVLDSSDRALLDALLADFVGGPAVNFDSGQLLNGSGPGGEKQGALTPGTGKLDGPITNGDITMEVEIPAGLGLTFTGKDGQTPDAAENYLNTAIGGYFSPNLDPNSDAGQQQQSLTGAVDDLLGSLGGGKDVSVRLIDFLGKTSPSARSGGGETRADPVPTTSAGTVSFDAGTSAGKQVLAFNLSKIASQTLVVKNAEAVLLAGNGSAVIDNAAGVRVNSDNMAQSIVGGSGNDTLVGAGNDTLTGGAGNDVFGFTFGPTAKGHYTITDFNKNADSIGVKLQGVTDLAGLAAAVTKMVVTPQGVTYEFGPDISVTLLGVNPTDLTASLLKFTF